MTSSVKYFRKILADWIGEMEFEAGKRHSDGTPIMGKFETEQLFRAGKEFLSKPEDQASGDSYVEGFNWINSRCVAQGEDFEYKATCLCSFPKKDGKVRYVVEDNGRLFIQRGEQIKFIDDRPFDPEPTVREEDKKDVHTERAEREGISRQEAKVKNYRDAYDVTPPADEERRN